MSQKTRNIWSKFLFTTVSLALINACAPEVTCPTGHVDAGKGIEKKRTDNGIIIKKNPKPKKKKH